MRRTGRSDQSRSRSCVVPGVVSQTRGLSFDWSAESFAPPRLPDRLRVGILSAEGRLSSGRVYLESMDEDGE